MTEQAPEVRQQPRRLWKAYASAGFALGVMAQALFLVPLRAREMGASFDVIGLIAGAGALAAVFASVPSGALIDRFGPKRTFVIGAALTGAVSMLFPLVTNYWLFLPLQAFLGVARNSAWMASQSYITRMGNEEERPKLTGRFSFVSSAGQMVGPLLAGAAAELIGLRAAMFVPAAYAFAFAVLGLTLAETGPEGDSGPTKQGAGLRSAWNLMKLRGIQVVVLLTFTRLFVTSAYTTFLPAHLVDQGIRPAVAGTVIATSSLMAALGGPMAGFLSRGRSQQMVALVALMCGSAALLIAPYVIALPWVFLVPVLVGLGAGISWPLLLSTVTTSAPPGRTGVALGLRGMAAQGGMTAAPLAIGPLIALIGVGLGFTIAGLLAAAMLGLAGALERRRDPARDDASRPRA